ncbi:MAG: 4-oxalocrotonate decarboxylase [Myxococcales bacterium]|nr:4-oxalocrotonate decarboxylase [Myxococcales bacterium]
MTPARIAQLGDELHLALRTRVPVEPLTAREPALTIDDAYAISRHLLDRRLADGERVVGKKIGVTSKVVQRALDVHQPDFGWLTDRMRHYSGDELPIGEQLIQPRAEGEIAFVLKRALCGPGITPADVVAATECVMACFEVVDSRIRDWKIRIQDTIADNASSGLFALSREAFDPRRVDFVTCGMVVEKNGEVISTGAGAAALGSPLACVAWLANTLGAYGVPLEAGEVILSGSLVPLEPVRPGDHMRVRIGGMGAAEVRFT